eukprot:m.16351 g.16351  ORF g.16351 m.16351 type:complete len:389 (+) comp7988_c0_seq1:23-1189(+)
MEIGFLEEEEDVTPPQYLTSPNFPSKVGGRPAWLDFENLPREEELTCYCGKKMVFLAQVYSGGLFEGEETYHRCLFVFICPSPSCNNPGRAGGFRVFRQQLPQENCFYSTAPPDNESDEPAVFSSIPKDCKLCFSCGLPAKSSCKKCSMRFYCNREHQVWHWKHGHKEECSEFVQLKKKAEATSDESDNVESEGCYSSLVSTTTAAFLFPERLIVLERDEEDGNDTNDNDDDDDEDEDDDELNEGEEGSDERLTQKNLNAHFDKLVLKYKKALDKAPDQILRYHKGGDPVWIGSRVPSEDGRDIPMCPLCGCKRQFEFEIMPQLQSILDLSLERADFGVIAVFSCANSCNTGGKTVPEVVWHNTVSKEKVTFDDEEESKHQSINKAKK